MPDVPDLDQLAAEIAAEVHRRRSLGEFPPDLERRLDTIFARYAPPGAVGSSTEAILERAIERVTIDTNPSTASARPGVPVLKAGLRRAMAWYIRFVADQVSALGLSLVEAGQALDRRVGRLELLVSDATAIVAQERRFVPIALLGDDSMAVVTARLRGLAGRVLHTDCGDGGLVQALITAGVEAYGVGPRRDGFVAAARRGLDLRPDDGLEHLRRVEDAKLAAVVLSTTIDTAPLAQQLEALDHAVRAVAPGGLVLVLTTAIGHLDPLAVDLATGRPLRPATWRHLLVVRGCVDIDEATIGSGTALIAGRRPEG